MASVTSYGPRAASKQVWAGSKLVARSSQLDGVRK